MTNICVNCSTITIAETAKCACSNPNVKQITLYFTLEKAIESIVSSVVFKLKKAIEIGNGIQMEGDNIAPLVSRLEALYQIQFQKKAAIDSITKLFSQIERSTNIDCFAENLAERKLTEIREFKQLKRKADPEGFFAEIEQNLKDKANGIHVNEPLPINLGGKL